MHLPQGLTARSLLHDRDRTVVPGFDATCCGEGGEVVQTPYPAPQANAVAVSIVYDNEAWLHQGWGSERRCQTLAADRGR